MENCHPITQAQKEIYAKVLRDMRKAMKDPQTHNLRINDVWKTERAYWDHNRDLYVYRVLDSSVSEYAQIIAVASLETYESVGLIAFPHDPDLDFFGSIISMSRNGNTILMWDDSIDAGMHLAPRHIPEDGAIAK